MRLLVLCLPNYLTTMTTKEIIHLQSLLCKMKPGPYEYWNEPGNDIIAAECKEGDGEPIAALAGIYSMEDEFRAIAALLNAAPELIKLALLANLNAAQTLVTEIAQGFGLEWQPLENSPRDGTVFMAYVPHDDPSVGGFQFCAVWNTRGRLLCMMSGDDYTAEATLWRPAYPLPENH